ncbi:MAG TPA: GNAT family N-acetyltransferase [Solirubrobacteraceae bacterium]|nr:GNAT family N-acetyltransferase [Solirubrobacteraceae bacterium]
MIRRADPADAGACAELYAPYVRDSVISSEAEPPTVSEIRRRMDGAHLWLVAEEGSEIVGYAYGSPHRERDAYRWAVDVAIYLHPERRGRGLGRRLYAELIEGLRERGACVLCAGVALPNPASERLHLSLGFAEVGTYRRIAYKSGRWIDTRWYELELHADGDTDAEPPARDALRLPHERSAAALGAALELALRHSADRRIAAARAADAIRAHIPWRWVGIYSVSDGRVTNEAWSGPAPPAHLSFPATAGLTATAVETGETVVANDVTRDPRYLANQAHTGSEMIVPVLRAGTVVGTLDVESDCANAFGERDRALAVQLAGHLAPLWTVSPAAPRRGAGACPANRRSHR